MSQNLRIFFKQLREDDKFRKELNTFLKEAEQIGFFKDNNSKKYFNLKKLYRPFDVLEEDDKWEFLCLFSDIKKEKEKDNFNEKEIFFIVLKTLVEGLTPRTIRFFRNYDYIKQQLIQSLDKFNLFNKYGSMLLNIAEQEFYCY